MSLKKNNAPTDLTSKKEKKASKKRDDKTHSTSEAKNVKGLPENEALEHPTEVDDPQLDVPGDNTENLSDFTDGDDNTQGKPTSGATSWYYRLQPLIRSKRVRVYAATNFILFLINVILIIILAIVGVLAAVAGIQAKTALSLDKPCLYEFTEWSKCSGECTMNGTLNYKTRKVIPESIVIARGKFARQAPCPDGLEHLEEKAPCNTHACPVSLSSIGFRSECWPIDANDISKGCYTIRDIPAHDIAITIDTVELIQSCSCETATTIPP